MENWNTLFREIKYPSVELFLTTGDVEHSHLNVVVCTDVRAYPKYVIHFERYLAFRSNDESGFEFDFMLPENTFLASNSIVLEDSPWLKSKSVAMELIGQGRIFRHFVFVGGDNVIEIISDSSPYVSISTKPQNYNYEI